MLGIPATGPAQSPGIGALRQQRAALAAQSRRAVVELYGLESSLAGTQAALARAQARAGELAARRAAVRAELRVAQQTMRRSQLLLGRQLRILYQQDDPDPIAVVLGATSLDDAIERLDTIRRTAHATRTVLLESRAAQSRLQRAQEALAVEIARNRAAIEAVAAERTRLQQAQAERSGYLRSLRQKQELTAAQISTLEQRARAARDRAKALAERAAAATPSTAAAVATAPTEAAVSTTASTSTAAAPGETAARTPASGPPRPGSTMTVYATGYCLRGTTATGLPVAPGIVAVDPTVIPLGTRMTIPGYGEGVAADVGGAIKGARIDVWIASCAEAAAFTRTVTITFR